MKDAELGSIQANHPFFKGCTKPAMFAKVPLVPFLLISGSFAIAGLWILLFGSAYVTLFLAVIYGAIYATMRAFTQKDDQRLNQMILRIQMRMRHAIHLVWGVVSYSPLRMGKKK